MICLSVCDVCECVNPSWQKDFRARGKHWRRVNTWLLSFMFATKMWCCRIEAREIQEACQACLQDFNLCMFYQPPKQEGGSHYVDEDTWPDDKAQCLNNEIIFKIVIMCEIVCYQLQKQGT